ncbi:HNH endonuclease signature motif containing protein [Georgenia sp. SYP-B2076]|uniref:HNH endonuclease signature motif containing protein n=1 Tax=Georgenia sp. SYP-B2076 TaxID=2495881 RepID=UPI0013E078C8|nr:HNH endonuclease signature motif containing protein [Georgenia sp. SYP-B2076]
MAALPVGEGVKATAADGTRPPAALALAGGDAAAGPGLAAASGDAADTAEAPGAIGALVGPTVLLAGVRAAVAALALGAPGSGASGWEHGERERMIAGVDAAIRELTVYRGGVLLAHKEDGRWGIGLDRDFTDWRARVTGTGRGPAAGELQVAEGLAAMPEVARAVADGDLNLEHAKALTRLRAGASAEVKDALDHGVAADLVERAKELSAPELARAAKAVAAGIDAQAAQASFAAVWRRRSVTSRRGAGGRAGTWFLDDVGGTIVDTALDAVVGTLAAGDDRTREQRRADALVTMAARVLQVGADLNGAQVRPHLAVLATEETWTALRRRRQAIEAGDRRAIEDAASAAGAAGTAFRPDPGASPGVGCGGVIAPVLPILAPVPLLPDVAPAELEDGSLVPLGELERLMCDCELTRIVMDAQAVPLDVGQSVRTYTKELRRGVTSRDRSCQWPGCTLRASWCEVHHIWHFSHGGPTSVENGCTLCTYHHHRVHDQDIRITILADGFDFHYRDGRHIGTTHRRPGPARAGRTPDALTPPRPVPGDLGTVLAASWPPSPTTANIPASTGLGTTEAGPTGAGTTSRAGGAGTSTTTSGAPRPGVPTNGPPPPSADGTAPPAPPPHRAAARPAPPPPAGLWDDDIPPGQDPNPPF